MIKEYKIDVLLAHTDEKGIEAYYSPKEQTLYINESHITEQAEEEGMPVEDYAQITFAHEIGHITDEDLPDIDMRISNYWDMIDCLGYKNKTFDLIKELRMQAEKNAWDRAVLYIKERLKDKLPSIRKKALRNSDLNLEIVRDLIKIKHEAKANRERLENLKKQI